jgi:hypothetical protein
MAGTGVWLAVTGIWGVVGMMAVCGLAGGVVNMLTLLDVGGNDGRGLPATRTMVWRCLASGLLAAFLVPLFLQTISSQMLTDALDSTKGYAPVLALAGFCLIAGVSSRAFIQTISERVLREVREAKDQASAAEGAAKQAEGKAEAAKGAAAQADRKADALALSPLPLPSVLQAFERVGAGAGDGGLVSSLSSSSSSSADAIRKMWDEDPEDKPDGVPERDGRRLTAVVRPFSEAGTLAAVRLEVRATDPGKPLAGPVTFRLHPTFPRPEVTVQPSSDGVARLNLTAIEAFTAAALTDDGQTRLQLNLCSVKGGPAPFYKRCT